MSLLYADFENSKIVNRTEKDPRTEIIKELTAFLKEQAAGNFTSPDAVCRQACLFLQEKKEKGVIFSYTLPQATVGENNNMCEVEAQFVLPEKAEHITTAVEVEARQ